MGFWGFTRCHGYFITHFVEGGPAPQPLGPPRLQPPQMLFEPASPSSTSVPPGAGASDEPICSLPCSGHRQKAPAVQVRADRHRPRAAAGGGGGAARQCSTQTVAGPKAHARERSKTPVQRTGRAQGERRGGALHPGTAPADTCG